MEYIHRKIEADLLEWKESEHRKPLLLRGARQVGKSTVVRHLGKEFENYVEVNFELHPELIPFFEQNLDPHRICEEIETALGVSIVAGKTLLFFDEIQRSQSVIKSLWFFYENYPELHLIAAGSLLEFALAEADNFAVGRIRSMYVYPLSFDEFLEAQGYSKLVALKKERAREPLEDAFHNLLCKQLRYYYIIGGMPESVKRWIETRKYSECKKVMGDIADTYFDDFRKYGQRIEPELLAGVLRSVPMQIGSKFKISNVDAEINNYKAKKALDALCKAGLIIPITHTATNAPPLGGEANLKFRKYIFLDTGLMLHIQNMNVGEFLTVANGELVNKGNVAEMFVGLEMVKYKPCTERPYLYYWQGDAMMDENGKQMRIQAEVDYVADIDDGIVPIEVKAGGKGSMHSMNSLLNRRPNMQYGIRCALEKYSEYGRVRVYPLYAVSSFAERKAEEDIVMDDDMSILDLLENQ